ncbi:MAG: N-6 DNA methylase [Planctomycetia bacterium]|nr:N-6 DNA methylase [Planctomycetia bacterium]MCC7316192.1 N-6 DNA methylase [Planctomycetota bacterium]
MAGPPEEIVTLIEKFRNDEAHYRSTNYNETQCRIDFINPMFELLGWDMNNRAGYAEAYRDVIHEDAIKIGGATKAPDYCFRIGGTRKFFVEAKKPGRNLKNDAEPAFQLRRYAWSAKLPLSILTDFEEFAVYDCRRQPVKDDKPSTARTFYCTFDEYPDKWDEIAGIFSRESLLKGSFDKYAVSARKKRGTAEVDTAFLDEIADWRKSVAKNVALRNPQLSQRELNFAVQRTIDRIIFLRICEDRGIEPYGRLQSLQNGSAVYARLCEFFRSADDKYNSGIFHFRKEKDRHESPDELTLSLEIDDKVLKDILKRLYYPESPYEFSVLTADILGQVYEQFLGEVIVLKGRQAKVEPKPEVRKAGGVYYTPTYIVDYIVRHTVGRLLGDEPATGVAAGEPAARVDRIPAPPSKTPKDAAKLRILDPACGSGSFLIAAYQYLLDWHLRWYVADDPEKHATGKKAEIFRGKGGAWRLTTAERKRILLNNIYGVDIDPQAVEVTKLSLLLKVLEGESAESVSAQWKLFHERALPDLGDNIKCGNSLIGPDFYANKQMSLLDEEERLRINVFDWNAEFSEIMKSGGFDALIGNPPYGSFFGEQESLYLRSAFECPSNSLDSFIIFVEKSSRLLGLKGLVGMIIPSGWVSTPSSKPLRHFFLRNFVPTSFVSLPFDIFKGAYIDAVIVTAQKSVGRGMAGPSSVDLVVFPARFCIQSQHDFVAFKKLGDFASWSNNPHIEFLITCSTNEVQIVEKLRGTSCRLADFVLVKRGIETFKPVSIKANMENPVLAFTGTLQRYDLQHGEPGYIPFTPEIQESKPIEYFSGERILLRQVLSRKLRLQAVYTDQEFFTAQSVQSLITRQEISSTPSLQYLLGVINSKLMSWFFRNSNSVARRDDFPKIIIQQTRDLPIPKPDDGNSQCHDTSKKIASGVKSIQIFFEALRSAKTEHETRSIQRQIEATDRQIDQLVYQLYGLTDEEIRIVEESTKT